MQLPTIMKIILILSNSILPNSRLLRTVGKKRLVSHICDFSIPQGPRASARVKALDSFKSLRAVVFKKKRLDKVCRDEVCLLASGHCERRQHACGTVDTL